RSRLVRLEFRGGQLRRSLGWHRIWALAMEARVTEALCDVRDEGWGPGKVRRRPDINWHQRRRTQAADCRQTRIISCSRLDESGCAANRPRGRFEQYARGPC